jgi:hypothetical protein
MALKRMPTALAIAAALVLLIVPTALASQPVYKGGTGKIAQTCGGDLDNGSFGCVGDSHGYNADYDIYFIAHTSTNRVITYNNHNFVSKIVEVAAKPSYATCKASNPGFNEYPAKANVGHWFCVLTTQGRYARVTINSVGSPYMTVTYRTWCKAGDAC